MYKRQVLGNPGENETEMHAILAEFELPAHFQPEVEKEAETIDSRITEEEIKKMCIRDRRMYCRGLFLL